MFLPPGQPCGIQAGTSFAASFTHTHHTHAPASRQEVCRLHGSAYVHSPILSHVLPPSHARQGLDYQAGLVWRVWLPGFWAVAFRQRPVESELRSDAGSLRRRLTSVDLTMIGIGSSIGSGIFVITGVAAKSTGPAVCFSFLIAAVSCIFSALCYAELAARIPVSGSVYLYAYVAFGEFLAVLFGLNVLVDYHVGAAISVSSCASYLRKTLLLMFPAMWLPDTQVLSLVLVAVLTGILSVGVESGLKRVNGLLVFSKMVIVLLIIGIGSTKVRADNLSPFFPCGFGPVASMSATCSFSFIGFGTVTNAAEECQNPQRDLPIGITASLLICAILYIFFSLVLVGIIPYTEIDEAAPVEAAFSPQYANIPWVSMLVNWGAVIGLFTTLVTGLYSQARMYLAMARDGLFFSPFGRVSTLGTPVNSQVLCGVIAALLAVFLPVERLVLFLNIGVLFSYTIVCAGVLVLRADAPEKAARWAAMMTCAAIVASASSTFISQSRWALISTSVFASAVALCWIPFFQRSYSRPETFACPGCPWVPLLGLTINGYMLSQCHWQAWLRLLATTFLILAAYLFRVRALYSGGSDSRELTVSLPTVNDDGDCIDTTAR
ncbi:CAT9 [Symbiodinium microadriaticum]|nr:CAT9 [Symbiodinium microadriaticum]CAE7838923.1 CAT9 [Symbiodinium sp. KB8]